MRAWCTAGRYSTLILYRPIPIPMGLTSKARDLCSSFFSAAGCGLSGAAASPAAPATKVTVLAATNVAKEIARIRPRIFVLLDGSGTAHQECARARRIIKKKLRPSDGHPPKPAGAGDRVIRVKERLG